MSGEGEEVRSNVSSMVDSNNDTGMSVMNSEDDGEDDDGNGNDDEGEDDERFGARRILLECTAVVVVVAGNARMLTGKTDTATVVAIATMLRRDFIFVVDEI